jgi:alcohol dehydrogenase
MKALVYTRPGEVLFQEFPDPELVVGEVILKIEVAGICGSDLHAWHGHDPRRKPGLVLGHEFVGTIEHSTIDAYARGQLYTGNPFITCGVCEYCFQGRNNLCSNRTVVGMTRPGAFAQLMSIPAKTLVSIPQGMSIRAAALSEPVATAWHAINLIIRALTRPIQECRVLVLGGGAIGMLTALLLHHLGAREVVVAEVNNLRREAVARYTGSATVDPIKTSITESSFDIVIDAVGSKATRIQALAAAKSGSVVTHVGLQDWASEIDMRKLTLAEITLLGSFTYTTSDLRAAVLALHAGVFGDLAWVEERKLDQGQEAFLDLTQGRCTAAKILLKP